MLLMVEKLLADRVGLNSSNSSKPLKTIVLAAVVGGALDYLYISASVYISGGSILRLWQYVASGLFGSSAYSMGIAGAVCGTPFSTSYS